MKRRAVRAFAALAILAAGLATAASATAADALPAGLSDCHVAGFRNGVLCGSVKRPLDPEHAEHGSLEIKYVVVPALARRKLADPVFFLAGGPGQSATVLAPQVMALFSRLNNRRDIVFVDQRGTGGSAPLACKDPEDETLAEQAEPERQVRLLSECKAALLKKPYLKTEADLGFFTTAIAVQDLDAVRRQLGAERVDLIGGSYGTRVALEMLRQFPQTVRRTVIDGVAPPDMALPASFSTDNQAAFDRLAESCAAEPACAKAHPDLRARFAALLQGLPREAKALHPLTGIEERFTLTRELVLGAVRGALYSPPLAAALPEAIDAAARGDYAGLIGLSATQVATKSSRLAMGMHFSVVCAEDLPRLAASADKPGGEFGNAFARMYEKLCSVWPRGAVPAAFYTLPTAPSATLVLSGGIDPATPPRHGERVAKALGPLARHVVVANAGHGVMAIGCMRDVVFRFVDAGTDAEALAVDASCAAKVPRPPAFVSLRSAHAKASEPGR
ncbi:MAG: alpha/beta hydrolase [Burkholderiales bacterium]|nr:alpha/beta hydrolase [Burkholderiales bacterium]